MSKEGESKLFSDSMPNSELGDSIIPGPLVGELYADSARLGVNFSFGVEEMVLMLVWVISARIFADLDLSRRCLFADLFSGEPVPGAISMLGFAAKIS